MAIHFEDLRHSAAQIDQSIDDTASHIANTVVHITSAERSEWNAKASVSDVNNEAAARQQADEALQTAINGKAPSADLTAETTARTEADTKLTAALAELIDGGAKNRLSINSGSTTSGQGYFIQNLPISLPAGTYIWSMKRTGDASTSFVLRDVNDNELARITRGAGVTNIVSEFTITGTATSCSIYVGYNTDVTDAMICSKAFWDISQKFVPYVPSNSELYEMILSL